MQNPAVGTKKSAVLHDYPQNFKYYDLLVSAFVAVLLISNLVAPKFIAWGPFRFSGAQLLFPITYIFGDIFTEEEHAKILDHVLKDPRVTEIFRQGPIAVLRVTTDTRSGVNRTTSAQPALP